MLGDGEREIIPDAILGFPIDLNTVSSVFSILRSDRVKSSCFLRANNQIDSMNVDSKACSL